MKEQDYSQFHYYGTYLAARLADVPPKTASMLATCTRAIADQLNQSLSSPDWQFNDQTFRPISSAASVAGQSERLVSAANENRVRQQHEDRALADSDAFVEHTNLVDNEAVEGPEPRRFPINPLTDVDWADGGKLNARYLIRLYGNQTGQSQRQRTNESPFSFGESSSNPLNMMNAGVNSELYEEHQESGENYEDLMDEGLSADIDRVVTDEASSVCSEVTLQDIHQRLIAHTIVMKRTQAISDDVALKLLACRLYVMQRDLMSQNDDSTTSEISVNDESRWLAFLQTMDACQQYSFRTRQQSQSAVSDKNTFQLPERSSIRLKGHPAEHWLKHLVTARSVSIEQEYFWLARIPVLLGAFGMSSEITQERWWQGFRYWPGILDELAMVASGAGPDRQVTNLPQFVQSDYYQLQRGMMIHLRWTENALKTVNASDNDQIITNLGWL